MTILITAPSGKIARHLIPLPTPSHEVLLASRSGKTEHDTLPCVQFNWTDPSTFTLPFTHPLVQREPITAVYLVSPLGNPEPFEVMRPFIDLARDKGVRRFVLISSIRESAENGFGRGKLHAYLAGLERVEWAVLRPNWFMNQFASGHHGPTIRDEGVIRSAAEDGKISFVAAEDVARVAAVALTQPAPPDREYIVVGPEALSHDEVAKTFTEVLGRPIRHERVSGDEVAAEFMKLGVSEDYAKKLGGGEVAARSGEFGVDNRVVEDVCGRPGKRLKGWVEENRRVWES